MPVAVTEIPVHPLPLVPPRKRWTRGDLAQLETSGLFNQERVELIEGELISKMGKNRPHVDTATLLFLWLVQVFGPRFVNQEAPIDVHPEDNPTNQPEPDLIVLKRSFSKFRSATPQPDDLALVVEVSDTSLSYDLSVKAPLYARAGIAEYWILDIQARHILVHRAPQSGKYTSVIAFNEHESVAPLAAPASEFPVRDAFAPEG
jgi:Uma2 family endonuclease